MNIDEQTQMSCQFFTKINLTWNSIKIYLFKVLENHCHENRVADFPNAFYITFQLIQLEAEKSKIIFLNISKLELFNILQI